MKTKPTLYINLHCDEGRGAIQLSLEPMFTGERALLVDVFSKAKHIEFALEKTDDGRHCMKITLGLPMVETVQ